MSDILVSKRKQKPKRMFSRDEKNRIVEEFLSSKLSALKFAPKYDIVGHTLSAWVKQYEQPQQTSSASTKRGGP